MKLTEMDYVLVKNSNINNLPSKLFPFVLTNDGILIEVLQNNGDVVEDLFESYCTKVSCES